MLIRNIELVDKWSQVKEQVYEVLRRVNNSVENISNIYVYMVNIVLFLPSFAILFKDYQPFPEPISEIFRVFLLTTLPETFGVSYTILTALLITITFTTLLLIVVHFFFASIFEFVSKMLLLLFKFHRYLVVPLADYLVYCIVQTHSASSAINSALSAILAILLICTLLATTVQLKFDIHILRKKNPYWNLDNDLHLYAFLYLWFRGIMVAANGTSIGICLVSAGVWFFVGRMEGGSVNKPQRLTERIFYDYLLVGDISVALSLFIDDQEVAFNSWLVLFGLVIVYGAVNLYLLHLGPVNIPPCQSNPQTFINCYFLNLEEGAKRETVAADDEETGIFDFHRLHCPKMSCQLVGRFDTANQLEEAVDAQLAAVALQCIDNRLTSELWNMETGKKCVVEFLKEKDLNWKQDFIVYSIGVCNKDSQVSLRNSEASNALASKVFYDLIYELCINYSSFYEELARTNPKIDVILREGTTIRQKVDKLKTTYSELLKSKLINFKMIELYLEFCTHFVNGRAMEKESIVGLMKLQQRMHFEDICDNYLPTLSLYPETGNLENVNAEAQKFLQSTRFELKYRNISAILYPAATVDQLKLTASEEHYYSFFKRGEKNYECGRVTTSERVIKQKKLTILEVAKEPFSPMKNMLLLNDAFEIELMMRERVRVRSGIYKDKPLSVEWREIFRESVLPQREKLQRTKLVKIETDFEGLMLIIKQLNCLAPGYSILLVQLVMSSEAVRDARTETVLVTEGVLKDGNHGQFEFKWNCRSGEKLSIFGVKNGQKFQRSGLVQFNTLDNFDRGIRESLVQGMVLANKDYARDIRTYRLWESDLYNIDLEDKEGYYDTFEMHVPETKKKEVESGSTTDCYIFLGVLLLGLTLVSFSVVMIVQYGAMHAQLEDKYVQNINIESFSIDFQRIMAVLGIYADRPDLLAPHNFDVIAEVEESYRRIQHLKNETLFNNSATEMTFNSMQFSGSVNELVDVILAHVTEFMSTLDTALIEKIHDTCFTQLNQIIVGAHGELKQSMLDEIDTSRVLKNALFYTSMGLVLVLYLFMLVYCVKSSYRAKESISELMMMNDGEARVRQENAEKMKYAVEMSRKNFEVDTQGLLQECDQKRRKNPKEAVVGREIVYAIGIAVAVGLIAHIVCLFFFSLEYGNQIDSFEHMVDQTEAVNSIYGSSVQLVNEIQHTQQLYPDRLLNLRAKLAKVEKDMDDFVLSDAFKQEIISLFFENSCDLLLTHGDSSQCNNTCPGFTITNPFEIGLALYFHRQNYYISNNLTENQAHASLYSRPFARIFTNLTAKSKTEGLEVSAQTVKSINLINAFMIVIDCLYIVVFVASYCFYRKQQASIKDILNFFTDTGAPQEQEDKNRKKKEDNDDGEEGDEGTENHSEEDEEKVLERKENRSRKMTLDTKLMVEPSYV